MARLILTIRCAHTSGRRHDVSSITHQYTTQFIHANQLGAAALRRQIEPMLQAFRVNVCDTYRYSLFTDEEIYREKYRRKTILLSNNSQSFLPGTALCTVCGWYFTAGIAHRNGTVCYNPHCNDVIKVRGKHALATARKNHQRQHLCTYEDTLRFQGNGLCTERTNGRNAMCDEHRGKKCSQCNRQAVSSPWNAGNTGPELRGCERHSDH